MKGCEIYENCGRDCIHCEVVQARNKQIPKSPINIPLKNELGEGSAIGCPCCKNETRLSYTYYTTEPAHCIVCGQALKWY